MQLPDERQLIDCLFAIDDNDMIIAAKRRSSDSDLQFETLRKKVQLDWSSERVFLILKL